MAKTMMAIVINSFSPTTLPTLLIFLFLLIFFSSNTYNTYKVSIPSMVMIKLLVKNY